MAAPRNNLSELRAKLAGTVNAAAPVSAAPRDGSTKQFKFKAASGSPATLHTVPHSANVGSPQVHPPPIAKPSTSKQPQFSATRAKRPSLEGAAPAEEAARQKRPRHSGSENIERLPTPVSRSQSPTFSLPPKSPQKPVKSASTPTTGHAPARAQSGHAGGNLQSMSMQELYTTLAGSLTTELDYTRKLREPGEDPVLMQSLVDIAAQRSVATRQEIQRREQSGQAPPTFQSSSVLSEMSLDHLRIMLVRNLTTELDQTRNLLDNRDGDTFLLESCINMASKRNADIKAEIARRDMRMKPASSSHASTSYLPPARSYSTPTTAPSVGYKSSSATIIDVDDMEIDVTTTTTTTKMTINHSPGRGRPLQSIENIIDLEAVTATATTTTSSHTSTSTRMPKPARAPSPDPDIAARKSPYFAEAQRTLNRTFKLDSFRKNQISAVTAALEGKDVFVLMPTGGGKSLCYQLPAVCSHARNGAVTVVISPLIALMTDQVYHLVKNGVDAFAFSSMQDGAEQKKTMARLNSGTDMPVVIYVTPERLQASTSFIATLSRLARNGKLARFVLDEAHCFATWGRDFRDAYKGLPDVRSKFPGVPLMALTATAKTTSIEDITKKLEMKGCVTLTQSFNRPNLRYNILKKGKGLAGIHDVIKRHPNATGIVYCLGRDECERVAKELRDKYKVSARHYHAGMESQDKTRTQQAWQSGECKVIVATIAFGMGIDKANVRFVVHHSMPKSLEGYYQETGRAGRDGQESECTLFYSQKDFTRQVSMIFSNKNKEQTSTQEDKNRQMGDLRAVMRFVMNDIDCRRSQVLNYFGEPFDRSDCHNFCDTCIDLQTNARENHDYTAEAQDALRLAREMVNGGGDITQAQIVSVFQGSQAQGVISKGHDKLKYFGKGAAMGKVQVERLFDYLQVEGALATKSVQNGAGWSTQYLKIGDHKVFDAIMEGKKRLLMSVRTGAVKVDLGGPSGTTRTNRAADKAPRKPAATVKTRAPKIQEDIYGSETEEDEMPVDNTRPSMDSFIVEDEDPIEIDNSDIGDQGWDFDDDDIDQFDWDAIEAKAAAESAPADPETDNWHRLHSALTDKRKELAKQRNVAEQEIVPDFILALLSATMPQDVRQFADVLKAELGDPAEEEKILKSGQALLPTCIAHRMQSPPPPPPPLPQPPPLQSTSSFTAGGSLTAPSLNAKTLSKFKFKKP